MLKRLLAPILLVLTGACASPGTLITSFDSLTSDTVTDRGNYLDQNRVFSLAGSLPQAAPGQFMQYSGKRGVSTGFGLSSSDSSFLQVKEMPAPVDATALISTVRNGILDVRLKALKAVRLRLDVAKERASQGIADTKPDPSPLTALLSSLEIAEGELDDAVTAANKLIESTGLLVVRWATRDESSAKLAAIVNASGNKTEAASGYLIMAGVREVTLFVGSDIKGRLSTVDGKKYLDWGWHPLWNIVPWFWSCEYRPYTRVTTRTVMAQEIAYLQDSEASAALQAKISASYSELTDIKGALEELDIIEVEFALSKASSLSNQGRLAGADWYATKAPYADDVASDLKVSSPGAFSKHKDSLKYSDVGLPEDHSCDETCWHTELSLDGWMTVFAVDANYWELCEIFDKE